MCKRIVFLTSFLVVLVLTGSASAQMTWTDEYFDNNDFNEPLNWNPNDVGPPGLGQGAITIAGPLAEGRSWPTMQADVNVTIDGFEMSGARIGTTGLPVADPCLVMYGRLTVEPGLIILGSGFPDGVDNTGTVHLMPGSYWRTQRDPDASTVHGVWSTQMGGQGHVVLDGGEWVADGLTLSFNTGGGGTLRINDGTFRTYFFEMLRGYDPWQIRDFYPTIWIGVCTSNLDIREGSLIIDGDRRDSAIPYEKYQPYERGAYTDPYYDGRKDIGIQGFIDRGWITAYGTPDDPCDPQHWYQPGNDDVNNWWMPKWGELIVEYVPDGNMVVPDEPTQVGHTVVTAYLGGYGEPYGLYPRQNATNVDPKVTLSWGPGDYLGTGGTPGSQRGNGHHVFIGTYDDMQLYIEGWNLEYPVMTDFGHIVGAQDANFLDVATDHPAGSLELATEYVWTVIEVSDANGVPDKDNQNISWWKAPIHYFRTLDPGPYDPVPADGSTLGIKVGVPIPLSSLLEWQPGYYASDVNAHVVYFGTDFNDVCDATGGTPQTEPNYTATGLELGKEYFWRVDEVNTAGPDPCIWPGDTWSFTVGDYRVIDEFDYDSWDDMSDFWQIYDADYDIGCLGGDMGGGAGLALAHGTMAYTYDNNGTVTGIDYFSEVRYVFPAEANNLTEGDAETTLRALSLDHVGNADNAADPNYDRMYVGLESSDGNLEIIWNPDVSAQEKLSGQFNIDLDEFIDAGVDVNDVAYLYLGFGIRCNWENVGGDGIVTFDNIRVYPPRCVGHPGGVPYYGQLGDLNGDCTVNIKDIKVLSNHWLKADRITDVPVAVAPNDPCMMARWEFEDNWDNDPNSRIKADSNGIAQGTPVFVPDETRPQSLAGNKVAYFDQVDVNDYVICGTWGDRHGDANFLGKSYTFAVWGKQTEPNGWACMISKGEASQKLEMGMEWLVRQVHFVGHGGNATEKKVPLNEWHHLAGTWEQWPDVNGGMSRVYIDGRLEAEEDMNEIAYNHSHNPDYDPNWAIGAQDYEGGMVGETPTPMRPHIDRLYYGYLDDVRVYDRQLSEEELMWLAGLDPGLTHYYAILPPAGYADIYSPDPKGQKIIDFKDMAKLAQEWLESAWWPVIP